LFLLVLGVSGCSILPTQIPEAESSKQYTAVDLHSAYPTISRENIEQINLLELIDPEQKAAEKYKALWDKAEEEKKGNKKYGPRYDLALSWFRQNSMSEEEKRLARNGVQERMLSASISRCNVFKTFLQRDQSDVSFWLGSATTVSGILGAVLPGATASRNLAGAAGMFSGIDAEHNQAYFSNLASNVLVKGIELEQSKVQEQLRSVGQKQSIADYPMEAAIRDAIYFDGLCSTVVGLEQAAESITLEKNPGLQQGLRAIISVRAMNEIANTANFSQLRSSGDLYKLQALATPTGSPLAAVGAPATTQAAVPDISETFFTLEPDISAYLTDQANQLAGSYKQKYDSLLTSVPDDKKAASQAKIKTPDAVLKEFLDAVNNQLITKLGLNNCGKDVLGLVNTLATARVDLRNAASDADRLKKSLAVDMAVSAIGVKQHKLQAVKDLAKLDIDAAVKASSGWDSTKSFDALITVDDKFNNATWPQVQPKASDLSGSCQ
jgi:hypothetical protein